MEKKITYKSYKQTTKIVIKNNYIDKYLKKLSSEKKHIFCIVDKKIKKNFKKYNKSKIKFIYLECNENLKSFSNYKNLIEDLLNKNIDRNSTVVAIGGGTLGDLCGFVTGTILRGVNYILIPTTLLSQVDSSIGGKNGINLRFGKNLVGTFNQPREVIIDIRILQSLPQREIKAGYSEILKHALIRNSKFFDWLCKNYQGIYNIEPKIIEEAITKSVMIKAHYVNKDPKEILINQNSRSMLNFGHTFGHALEAFYKYNGKLNHGEAISIGMVIESRISNKLGYLSDSDLNKILTHFNKAKLKMYDKNIYNDKLISLLKKDKKNFNGFINIVLLKKIGSSFFKRNISEEKLSKITNILK